MLEGARPNSQMWQRNAQCLWQIVCSSVYRTDCPLGRLPLLSSQVISFRLPDKGCLKQLHMELMFYAHT